MPGYLYSAKDSDIIEEQTKVHCAGLIGKAGEDGYNGTNWRFFIIGRNDEWHVHFEGDENGRKVKVIRYKSSSKAVTGHNIISFSEKEVGYPTKKVNLNSLAHFIKNDPNGGNYPMHIALLKNLNTQIKTYTEANKKTGTDTK